MFDWASSDLPAWRGVVGAASFELRRAIRHRNSFLPILHGVVEAAPDGAIVRVTARPHGLALGVMTVWIGIALSFAVGSLASDGASMTLACLGMAALGYTFMTGAFLLELRRSEELLRAQLPARSEASVGPFRSRRVAPEMTSEETTSAKDTAGR